MQDKTSNPPTPKIDASSDTPSEEELLKQAIDAMGEVDRRLTPKAPLLPVLDVRFNVREIAKQMVLLEDHLCQPRRRCNDCIRKHFAFIEALAEEGMSLDPTGPYFRMLADLQELCRVLYAELKREMRAYCETAVAIRKIRKPLLRLGSTWLADEKYLDEDQRAAEVKETL